VVLTLRLLWGYSHYHGPSELVVATNPGNILEERIKAEMLLLFDAGLMEPDQDTPQRRKGSGSVHGDGDVTAGPFEFECKDNPLQKSISITQTDWKRTIEAARRGGCKIPMFINKNSLGIFATVRWSDMLNLLADIGTKLKGE
jgi:hypothetical protein